MIFGAGVALRPILARSFSIEQPLHPHARRRVEHTNRIEVAAAVDQQRPEPATQFGKIRRGFPTPFARAAVRVDEFVFLVPQDEPANPAQGFAPEAVLLVRAASDRGQQQDQPGVERPNDLDIVSSIIDLHRIDARCQAGIIVAAPARDLGAFDCGDRLGVSGVDGRGADFNGSREGHVHPLFEIRPSGEIPIRLLQRFAGGHWPDLLPSGKMRAPLLVESIQAAIALPQPVAHPGQGGLGKVEIPKRRQIGNPGFVPEIVEERPVRLQAPDVADQAIAHLFEPNRVGKAGFANKGGEI